MIARRLRLPSVDNLGHLCSHCLQPEHLKRCDQHVQMCYHCFRLNFTTANCICKLRSGIAMYDHPQTLRYVGSQNARPFTDVTIMKKNFPGLIDTSSTQSSVDETLARFVLGLDLFAPNVNLPSDIRVPIEVDNTVYQLKCRIRNLEPGIHLYLAMDFHFLHPFTLSINGVNVNSRQYWTMDNPNDVDYVYNHHRGQNLRRKLENLRVDNFQSKYSRKF